MKVEMLNIEIGSYVLKVYVKQYIMSYGLRKQTRINVTKNNNWQGLI